MAVFKITPALSMLTTGFAEPAFMGDSPSADTLVVDAGAFLISRGLVATAVILNPTGTWTVTVNGSVVSENFRGIELGLSGGVSKLTVGPEGSISADDEALYITGSGGTAITNSGAIVRTTAGDAILDTSANSNDTLTNNGWITGNLAFRNGNNALTNSGIIQGSYSGGSGSDKITNSGSMGMGIPMDMGGGSNAFKNAASGFIFGSIIAGGNSDTVSNAGLIDGAVSLGAGTNRLTNSGRVLAGYDGGADADTVTNSGTIGSVELFGGTNIFSNAKSGLSSIVIGGAGNDTVTNSGLIDGDVLLSDGVNKLTNTKGLIEGAVTGGSGTDTVVNSGAIASVSLGGGNDKLTNTGTITAVVDLGSGDDTYIGGSKFDAVRDGAGSDDIKLGAGYDIYDAFFSGGGDGIDKIDGGTGNDVYDAQGSTASVTINLDALDHQLGQVFPALTGVGSISAKSAFGLDIGEDALVSFESAFGGSAGDVIYGSAAANQLAGFGGPDFLLGFAGNDLLDGDAGDDVLWGGTGKDTLIGGAGADDFFFVSLSDSGLTVASRDVIDDWGGGSFQSGLDTIWLTLIDAIAGGGDDAFTYINADSSVTPAASFTSTAGELRSYWSAHGHIFEGDVNGDAKADFSFEVIDRTHAITFTAADFML